MSDEITMVQPSMAATYCPLRFEHFVFPMKALLVCLLVSTLLSTAHGETADAIITTELQGQLGDTKDQPNALEQFYAARSYKLAWLHTKRLSEISQLDSLAELHGLNPQDYQLKALSQRLQHRQNITDPAELVSLDISITRQIARLAAHLSDGKVDPTGPDAQTAEGNDELNANLLHNAARSESLFAYLNALTPDTLLYRKLQMELIRQRRIQVNELEFPAIDTGRTLQIGMQNARVEVLRKRLGLPESITTPDVYDDQLAAVVADFQRTHLLAADGLAGKATIEALNYTVRQRIDQLRVNLDLQRWATMPEQEYLLVNVAHFRMRWIENDRPVWSMRTQVGSSKRPTPSFKSNIEAISVNPTWTVPPTIFREDVLPKLQAEADYLDRKNMYVIDRKGRAVDSSNINWNETTVENFAYRLRAKAGANALGRVKFLMPNPYSIYMHDTPAKHLFETETRAFSSGCIRLEQPEQFAHFLAGRQGAKTEARLEKAFAGEKTRYLGMATPVPIVVLYATIDLNDKNELVYSKDIYGKDSLTLAALDNDDNPDSRDILLAQR